MVGLVVFTLSSAACALSQTDTQLIGFRAVQGVGGALLNPLSLSILVAAFPRKQLPQAIGIWAGISGLGLAIGPLLGGFLTQHFSWSAVFWVNVPIGVVAMGVTAWAVIESRDPSAHSLDIVGTVLISAGLFALTWGLIQTASHAWLGAYTLSFLVARGGARRAVHGLGEPHRRADDPARASSASARSRCRASSWRWSALALFGVIYFLTLYFQNVQGLLAHPGRPAHAADDDDDPVRRADRRAAVGPGRPAVADDGRHVLGVDRPLRPVVRARGLVLQRDLAVPDPDGGGHGPDDARRLGHRRWPRSSAPRPASPRA